MSDVSSLRGVSGCLERGPARLRRLRTVRVTPKKYIITKTMLHAGSPGRGACAAHAAMGMAYMRRGAWFMVRLLAKKPVPPRATMHPNAAEQPQPATRTRTTISGGEKITYLRTRTPRAHICERTFHIRHSACTTDSYTILLHHKYRLDPPHILPPPALPLPKPWRMPYGGLSTRGNVLHLREPNRRHGHFVTRTESASA